MHELANFLSLSFDCEGERFKEVICKGIQSEQIVVGELEKAGTVTDDLHRIIGVSHHCEPRGTPRVSPA